MGLSPGAIVEHLYRMISGERIDFHFHSEGVTTKHLLWTEGVTTKHLLLT